MTSHDWQNIALFVSTNWSVIAGLATGIWLTVAKVAPLLQQHRDQDAAATAVAAAEQYIVPILLPDGTVDKSPLFKYADLALQQANKSLSADQRARLIEAAVANLHRLMGTLTPATPPAPTTAAQEAQQAQATKMQADFDALKGLVGDLATLVQQQATAQSTARTTKLARTAAGTFAPAAPVVVAGAGASEAAHPDPSASTTGG